MQVNLTANDISALQTAIDDISVKSAGAWAALNKIWKLDFSAAKITNSIGSLTTKVTILTARTQMMAQAATAAATAFGTMKMPPANQGGANQGGGGRGRGGAGGGGGGAGGGGQQQPAQGSAKTKSWFMMPPGDLFSTIRTSNKANQFNEFYGLTGSKFKGILEKVGLGGLGGGPSGAWVSKFGNPGQMPLVSRFRVFQRPFPGSERNPFSLGDSGNVWNNAVFSGGKLVEQTFRGIVEAGAASIKTLGGIFAAGAQVASVFTKMIPLVGDFLSGAFSLLGLTIKSLSETMGSVMSALGEAVGGVIQGMTTFGLMLSGFASRAVIAASNLTELRNAGSITSGPVGSKMLYDKAVQYQADYGLSSTDSMRMMTRISQQFRNLTNSSGEEAAAASVKVFDRVAEAGSVLNMNLDDMSKTVQSALAGRYTPLRRIGVAVSAPYLDQIAAQKGYTANAKSPFEARLRALLDEIERQTKPFAGDLAATRYEFANQNRKLMGLFEAIFIEAGRILEPFAKALLYVTNDVLSKFREFVKGFADSMQGSVDKYQSDNKVTGMLVPVMRFLEYTARAGDYINHFGRVLYANSDAIKNWVSSALNGLASIIKELLRFSGMMITWITGLVAAFPQVITGIFLFKDSLVALADWISWWTGSDPKANAVGRFDDSMLANEKYLTKLEQFQKGGYGGKGKDRRAQEVEALRVNAMKDAPLRDETLRLMSSGKSKADAAYESFGVPNGLKQLFNAESVNGAVSALSNLGLNIQEIAAMTPETLQKIDQNLNVPKVNDPAVIFNRIFGKQNRLEANFDPGAMTGNSGELVKYFSPAAFRDEIQQRQVSAIETVAENTTKMATILESMNQAAGAGGKHPENRAFFFQPRVTVER
jgi:hypothetical protein